MENYKIFGSAGDEKENGTAEHAEIAEVFVKG
jgi:hypothetical protein